MNQSERILARDEHGAALVVASESGLLGPSAR